MEQQRWGEALMVHDESARRDTRLEGAVIASSSSSPPTSIASRVDVDVCAEGASIIQQNSYARRQQQRRIARRRMRDGQREIDEYFTEEADADEGWGHVADAYRLSNRHGDRAFGLGSASWHQSSGSGFPADYDLEMALALSLSLEDSAVGDGEGSQSAAAASSVNLSYEALSELENVSSVLPQQQIEQLPVITVTCSGGVAAVGMDELCSICQCEYVEGDKLLQLPCSHHFHKSCASEWLSAYSKLCPMCKGEAHPPS